MPAQLLLLDEVLGVDLAKQRRVDMGRRELLEEMAAPIGNGERRLPPERLAAGQPFYLVRLQEAEPVPLPSLCLLRLLQPRQQRKMAGLMSLETGQVQLADAAAGHAVDLAQDPVAHVGAIVVRGHELAELEFDEVVDLLIGELLHH